jgi:hypothetical protein
MKIFDHISESLETIFWVKTLKISDAGAVPGIFLTLDTGWKKIRIRDKHPGSATLGMRWLKSMSGQRAMEQIQ